MEGGHDQNHLPAFFASFSLSSLPPLDQVTVCSEIDSASDVSSVSSDEEDNSTSSQSPVAPRAIFGRYWEKKGGAPALLKVPCTTHEGDKGSCSANTYERTLKRHEAPSPQASPSTRRSIFKTLVSESVPALSLIASMQQQEQLRKTHSTSALRKKRSSCLRRSRLAEAPSRTSSSDLSVSFSAKVDVVVYQQPIERWAANGWSDYFS